MRRWLAIALLLSSCSDGAKPKPKTEPDPETTCWVAPAAVTDAPVVAVAPLTKYVRPFIGTGGVGFGVGSTFPGPQTPFGMVRPGPDTMQPTGASQFAHCSGYSYSDPLVYGFSHTRMNGTGIVDYGTIGLMPTVGMTAAKTSADGRKMAFAKADEHASPGSYDVKLADGTEVEITATDHVALHRYTFATGVDANVLVDIGHALPGVKIVDGAVDVDPVLPVVTGFAHFSGGYSGRFGGMPVYFAARFSRPFTKHGVWKAGALAEGESSRSGGDVGAWFAFDATTDPRVGVALAISFVDVAHARANLDAESPSFDFDGTRDATIAKWESVLSRVHLEASSEAELEKGYTALYHTLLMPTLAMDVDGSYRGLDGAVHVASGYRQTTDFSLWDTYRTLHPWLTLVYPDYQRDMLRSLAKMAVESGAPPKWPLGIGESGGMVGDSSAIVFGDSVARGITDFDMAGAYDVLRASATVGLPHDGRDQALEYATNGWVSIESGGASGSKTLEYALDDFALANVADALGKTDDAAMFRARASNWQKLWDDESGFLLGRHADGSFPSSDDPTQWQDYWAEGTTWHYTWFVPHDVPGLAKIMGGRDAFLSKLDAFFAQSSCQPNDHLLPLAYYWQSNEPVLFVPWMYADLDDASSTAKWTRWALDTQYGNGPDGLPGNDDGGTMSAWWLFSSSGIYPRLGTSEYLISAPTLSKTTLSLPGGDLVVTRTGPSNGYPVSATLNGVKLARPRFDQKQIASGGALVVELASSPGAWH